MKKLLNILLVSVLVINMIVGVYCLKAIKSITNTTNTNTEYQEEYYYYEEEIDEECLIETV